MTVLELHDGAAEAPARAVSDRLVCHSYEGPAVREQELLALDPTGDQFVMEGRDGDLWFGLGCAAELQASGPGRIEELIAQADELFERLEVVDAGGGSLQPRVFGGMAFGTEVKDPSWSSFPAASFVLPRVLVQLREAGSRWMVVSDPVDLEGPHDPRRLVEELHLRLARHGVRRPEQPSSAPRIDPTALSAAPSREWLKQVEDAVEEIRRGGLIKVVCARRAMVERSSQADTDLLMALADRESPTRRFFFRRQGRTFLGNTPERLVRKVGLEVDTVALAGSLRREPGAEVAQLHARLLASDKDRREHQLVVDCIRDQLQPLCSSLECGSGREPSIRVLRYLIHLETAIRGRLRDPEHVLNLVQALHPTPAVGGLPRERALQWILDHETFDRGWYAGPVGWFDSSGDGDFHVALRSFLIDREKIHLFAGAGIVDGSQPEREFAETEDKLAAGRAALTTGGL